MTDFEKSIEEVNKQKKTENGYIVYYPALNRYDDTIGISWVECGFNTDDIEFENGSGLCSKTRHWRVKETTTKSAKFFSFYRNLEDIEVEDKVINKDSLWFRDESITSRTSIFLKLYTDVTIKIKYSYKEFNFHSTFDPNRGQSVKCSNCNGKGYEMLNHKLLGIDNFEDCLQCSGTGNTSIKLLDYIKPDFLK